MTAPLDDRDLLARLHRGLDHASNHLRRMDAYYHARQPLIALPEKVRQESPNLFSVALNIPRLIVDSMEARLDIEGFRTGSERENQRMWGIWQRNNCDETSLLVHTDALVHGRSFALTWADEDGRARITPESGRQCIVWQQPGTTHRIAGLKRHLLPEGRAECWLYLPEKIMKFRTETELAIDPLYSEPDIFASGILGYSHFDFASVPSTNWIHAATIDNPLGVVPLVPFENRKRVLNWGESELADVLNLADTINKLATDLMVSSEYHAQPRRYATGVQLLEDDDGNLQNPFDSTPGRTWLSEDPETDFGQFSEAGLDNYTGALTFFVRQVGAIASLPPHYLMLSTEPASADAIRSSEAPLVERVRRKQRMFGGSWEQVMRLATRIERGYIPAGLDSLETVWRSPETRTRSIDADYGAKLREIGVPTRQVVEDLGYSEEEIERMNLPEPGSEQPSPESNGHKDDPQTSRQIRKEAEIHAR